MFTEISPGSGSTGEKGLSRGEHLLPRGIGNHLEKVALGWPEALLTLHTKDYLPRESLEKVVRSESFGCPWPCLASGRISVLSVCPSPHCWNFGCSPLTPGMSPTPCLSSLKRCKVTAAVLPPDWG